MNKKVLFVTLISSLVLSSCSTENGYSEFERTEAYFLETLEGYVSPYQWWKTSVTLNVNVKTTEPVKIWVMSAETGGTLYDYREVTTSGIVQFSAPQGRGTTVYVVGICGRTQKTEAVKLTGRNEENVVLNFTGSGSSKAKPQAKGDWSAMGTRATATSADEPDPVSRTLYGSSVKGDAVLVELSDAQRNEYADIMNLLIREKSNAKTVMGFNVDYELESNGPFNITWIAGNCTSNTPHVLGYYYHTPGTYEDIQYVDICETEIYDVIDGKAKVQYQVNQTAIDEYPEDNLVLGKWYAANFDMEDRWGKNAYFLSRRGDNAWNSMAIFERYGRNICGLRGITFEINVPAGMRLGFYDRAEEKPRPDQYDRLVQKNVRPYTDRDNFKGTSYSAEAMNTINPDGNFRSFIEKGNNMMWMGMENDITGGDLDCNDVIFGVSAMMEIFMPSIVEPDFFPEGEYVDQMPWTIAYEDLAREADFDFNDAVIKVVPDFENELCCVTVEAAGSPARMYLHYDAPDGTDMVLGEMHEMLGGWVGSRINTNASVAGTPFVEVDCVPWPKDFTMANDAKRFWIEIQRGTCEDCTDMITLAETPGQIPQALLVAGEWKWPMEGVHIFSAYNSFPNWAKDVTKTGYWGWYSSPKAGTAVSY